MSRGKTRSAQIEDPVVSGVGFRLQVFGGRSRSGPRQNNLRIVRNQMGRPGTVVQMVMKS